MKVPEQIKSEARWLIEQYGDSFDYLGNYEGQEVYLFKFPEDSCTGFPFVYLFKDGLVTEITGFESLDIIGLLIKDVDMVDVE